MDEKKLKSETSIIASDDSQRSPSYLVANGNQSHEKRQILRVNFSNSENSWDYCFLHMIVDVQDNFSSSGDKEVI